MYSKSVAVLVFAVVCSLFCFSPVFGQADFPNKTIQVVVPFPGGGSSTMVMNIIGERMSKTLGKPVVVVNKPGGGTSVGSVFVAGSKPDGYTLLLGGGSFVTLPLTMESAPYKVSDFTPIGRMTSGDFFLAVNKTIPAQNLKEFIAYAQKNTGKLSYFAGTAGSLPRLGSEIMKDRLKIDAQYIPFAGHPQGVVALLGNHVQFGLVETLPSVPHIKSGDLKPLAIFSPKRDPRFPNVPTFVESGYPDVVTYTYFLLSAPAKTPAPIVKKLEAALKEALQDKDVRQKLEKIDSRADYLSADETKAFIDVELKKWSDIIKKAKIDFKE
ncbi:MAG TPA: tripartite tricarboxylate transporter substrate binding protein [Syntrophorhabdaceae bacterium]|nr:tripartite tricarboxylate transporter substrate binding protein [Syntrophorhabdaceae bacterium]